MVLTKSREDLARLLAAAPDPAQLVIMRKESKTGSSVSSASKAASQEAAALRSELELIKDQAEETHRIKEGLRSDNIRLTHRISYLEEQVKLVFITHELLVVDKF